MLSSDFETIVGDFLQIAEIWKDNKMISNASINFDTFDKMIYLLQGLLDCPTGLKKVVTMLENSAGMLKNTASIASAIGSLYAYNTQEISLEIGKMASILIYHPSQNFKYFLLQFVNYTRTARKRTSQQSTSH